MHCATSQPKLNSLEQSDREEAIECWLDSHKVADAWDLAPALVNARVDEGDLETVKRMVPAQDLENAIQWLAANLTTRDLLKSISHSTERISELVSAVKSCSFMDQAPWQELDVHEGIENTLIILGHKLRNVTVTRDFDRTLPRPCAYGGELNQVWTNLIDNAIYAVRRFLCSSSLNQSERRNVGLGNVRLGETQAPYGSRMRILSDNLGGDQDNLGILRKIISGGQTGVDRATLDLPSSTIFRTVAGVQEVERLKTARLRGEI